MYSFAHLSDVHLGFQKNVPLQQIEERVFEDAIDQCIKRKVDFVLIPGDLFHVNIPEMRVQKFAVRKFRQLHEAGIPVYVVYGSHDFSPVSDSVIDLLTEAGYLTKVSKQKQSSDDRISLEFTKDSKTGAKIVGLPGLTAGKELVYYENLDRESLESEDGFKIFLFHAGLAELKSEVSAKTDFMPISLLPKGFDYYAGGHMHTHTLEKYPDYPNIVYPGTLFSGYYSDLEENAKGRKRGFVLVQFDDKVRKVEFIPIDNVGYEIIEYNADKKNVKTVNLDLAKSVKEIDPGNKIVIINVFGELASGKTSEIDFTALREELKQNNVLEVKINRTHLSSRDYNITPASGKNKDEIETNVFKENIGDVRLEQKELLGDPGVKLAKKLLQEIGQPSLVNEKKAEYQKRIEQNAMELLELKIDDS